MRVCCWCQVIALRACLSAVVRSLGSRVMWRRAEVRIRSCDHFSTCSVQAGGVLVDGTAAAEHELMLLWSAVEQDRKRSAAGATEAMISTQQEHSRAAGNPFADVGALGGKDFTGKREVGLEMQELGERRDSAYVHAQDHDRGCSTDADTLNGNGKDSRDLCRRSGKLSPRAPSRAPDDAAEALVDSLNATDDAALQPPEPRLSWWLRALYPKRAAPQTAPALRACASLDSHGYDAQRSFWHVLLSMLADSGRLFRGPERRAVALATLLAVFNQIGASTSIINYAPDVLQRAGVHGNQRAVLMSSLIGVAKTVGVFMGA